jgi:hypothetical protein
VSWVGTPIAIAIGLAPADPDYAPVLTDLTSLIVVRCLEIVAGVVVGGAITGGVLTWVLRHPREGAVDQGTSEQDLDNLEDEPATAITGGYSAGG